MSNSLALPILGAVVGISSVGLFFASAYTVDEGNVAVITNMGRAVRQESPSGLRFKTPIVVGVREFDVRERALVGQLNASTSNQLATAVQFSVNWNPDPAQILDIFVSYGSPEEFARNTLQPRLQQSLKSTIGKFTGAQLTRERDAVAAEMLTEAQRVLASYPVVLSSVQLENFTLPDRYMEAVLQKEEQREATERESLLLEQQDIKSRQAVQTASSERDATKALADGAAYATVANAEAAASAKEIAAQAEANATVIIAKAEADSIRFKADAEAEGIEAIKSAIGGDETYIDWQRAMTWDGKMPQTILGESPSLIVDMTK